MEAWKETQINCLWEECAYILYGVVGNKWMTNWHVVHMWPNRVAYWPNIDMDVMKVDDTVGIS